MSLITLVEYARRHGKNDRVMRQKAARGNFETAQKIGHNWVIDEDEPYRDRRIKSGRYVDWRKHPRKYFNK